MEQNQKSPISEMIVLLRRMLIDFPNYEGKTMTRVRKVSESSQVLEEFFDDGHGHSNATSMQVTPIEPLIFLEAVRNQYITGVPLRNNAGIYCISREDFILTHFGKIKYNDLFQHQKLQEQKDKQENFAKTAQ